MKSSIFKFSIASLFFLVFTAFCVSKSENSAAEGNSENREIAFSNNKHALIIAIGDYKREETGWGAISSQNDVPLIKEALMIQGFSDANIALIQDQDADKPGILAALDNLAKKAAKGDMVVVHYSGHGQQIFDDNGDEIDGFDEALVSINAPARYHRIPDYTGQNHIRDEEFGAKIDAIRKKVGKDGHVLVILDSCHSGTGTRGGFSLARGGMPPLAPDDYDPKGKNEEEGSGLNESSTSRGIDNENMGSFVLFAGARFDELNYETKDDNGNGVGSLSYSISKAMTQVEQGESYRSLFAKVLAVMAEVAPNQSPMLEGDIDAGLFGGDVKAQTPYYNITQINGDTEIIIDGGQIHNLTEGSKVGLYKTGTKDPEEEKDKLIVVGTVSGVSPFSSTVLFEESSGLENEKSGWIFVLERNVEDLKLKVSLSELDQGLQQSIENKLSSVQTVVVTNDNPDVIVTTPEKANSEKSRGAPPTALILMASDVEVTTTESKVSSTVENYARGSFLKKVEYYDDVYFVDFELIPVKMKRTANGWEETDRMDPKDFMVEGVMETPVGSQYKLKIINKGMAGAYFNILDIQPDGYINPIAPNSREGLPPEVCFIEAGEEIEIPNYFITIGPPYGMETFKVFATKEEINLEPIIRSQGTKGTQSRGPSDFRGIEILMSDAFGTRGGSGSSTSTTNGSSFNKNFKIVE